MKKSQFKIEKDIPVPPTRDLTPVELPLDDLKVGESFLIPKKVRSSGWVKKTLSARNQLGKGKFRHQAKKDSDSTRVWRIS
jgi:hypothetical protein